MKKLFKEVFFWLFPVLLIAVAIPLGFSYILHADIPVWILVVLVWIKIIINYIINRLQQSKDETPNNRQSLPVRSLRLLSLLVTGTCAFLIIAIINITPYAIFLYWLESPAHAKDAVVIANIFVLLATFFTALQCGAVFNQRSYKPLLVLQALLLGLIVTIKPDLLFGILLCVALVILILTYIKKNRLLYLGVLLAASLVGFIIFSLFPSPQGSVLVDNFISPKLRFAVNQLIPDYPLSLGLPGYGYAFGEDKLGGAPTLSAINLFEVEGAPDKTFHLREEIYDLYTGSEWKLAMVPALPLSIRPVTSPPPAQQVLLKLKLIKGPYYKLPHTLDTMEIYYNKQAVTIPPQAVWDSKMLLKEPLPGGAVIYLVTAPQAATPTNQPHASASPETRPAPSPLPTSLLPFLQIPATLPSNVENCARALSLGLRDSRDILKRIEDFLAKNNVYDLNVPTLGRDEDFVEKFLFRDKRGYCVHFASAFIILARLNHIPARYISGYLLNAIDEPTHTGKRLITGLTSHAWPEVWLPDRGWVTWEATPAVNLDYYAGDTANNWGRHFSLNDYTLRQLSGILGRTLQLTEQSASKASNSPLLAAVIAQLPRAGLILAGLCLAGWLSISLFRLSKEYFYPREAILAFLKKLSRRHKDLPEPQKHGWLEWFTALRIQKPESNLLWDHWQGIVLKTLYSNQAVNRLELKSLKRIRKALHKFSSKSKKAAKE